MPHQIEPLCYVPEKYEDDRGWFSPVFSHEQIAETHSIKFFTSQRNLSKSVKNVLRGLHYQTGKNAQAKLISVIEGKILDVFIDLRRSSPRFGHYKTEIISSSNRKVLYLPKGFAHGFLTISDTALVDYIVDAPYDPNNEHCLIWNDAAVGIDWPSGLAPILSEKDAAGKKFDEIVYF